MEWYENLFIYISYVVYCLYLVVFLGIWDKASEYLHIINYYRQIIVSLLLLYFFNPWRRPEKFTEFHRKVVFTAALFLFASTLLSAIVNFLGTQGITLTIIRKKILNIFR